MPPSRNLCSILILFCIEAILSGCSAGPRSANSSGVRVEPFAEYEADPGCPEAVRAMRAPGQDRPPYERYRDLRLIDIHNHGTAGDTQAMLEQAAEYFVDRTVLFGAISEPAARATDRRTFEVYSQRPGDVYPFFAGFPIYDPEGIAIVTENLEQGYLGIGETVAASTYSPETSDLPWKAQNPNDGNLPEIYQLAASYRVPVLLHIDPPNGEPVRKLEQAMDENPETLFIFAHANAYNSPANIEALLGRHTNLYIDFFAGFTAFNPDSTNGLADFVGLIENFPDRFMVGTDSGYGVTYPKAAQAMYELLDLLTPETACKVAYQNFERMIELQLPTAAQIDRIETLSAQAGETGSRAVNKRQANELIFELQGRLP